MTVEQQLATLRAAIDTVQGSSWLSPRDSAVVGRRFDRLFSDPELPRAARDHIATASGWLGVLIDPVECPIQGGWYTVRDQVIAALTAAQRILEPPGSA